MPAAPPASTRRPIRAGEKAEVPGSEMDSLMEALAGASFPADARNVVVGGGARLGATGTDGKEFYVGPWAEVARAANRAAQAALDRAGLRATWTSIQVNVNSVAARHVDVDVEGLSLVLLGGTFCRGAFRTDERVLRDAGWLLAFDGTAPN